MQACIIGEILCVIGTADKVIRKIKVSVDESQLTLSGAGESGAGNNTEGSVSPIAVFNRVASSLRFQVVNIVDVEGSANIHSGVGAGDRHAVHQPGHLMTSVDV